MLELPIFVKKSRNHVALGHDGNAENTGSAFGRHAVRRHGEPCVTAALRRGPAIFTRERTRYIGPVLQRRAMAYATNGNIRNL